MTRRQLVYAVSAITLLVPTIARLRAQNQRPTMSLQDVLAMREIADIDVTADGTEVLFTVKTSNLTSNSVETTLWTLAVDGSRAPAVRLPFNSYSRPHWRGRSHDILFLGPLDGRVALWQLAEEKSQAAVILDHPDGISAYFPAPDGSAVAFTCKTGARHAAERREQLMNEGAILDTTRHGIESTLATWEQAEYELWIRDSGSGKTAKASLAQTSTPWREIVDVTWSPDAARLAVTVSLTNVQQTFSPGGGAVRHVLLLDRRTGRSWRLGDSDRLERQLPRWSPDGERVLVAHKDLFVGIEHPIRSRRYGWENRLIELRMDGSTVTQVSPPNLYRSQLEFFNTWWSRDGRIYATVLGSDGLTETVVRVWSGRAIPVVSESLTLSACALAQDVPALVCRGESVAEPPEVVRIDLDTGAATTLTALNGRFKAFQLAAVEPWYVENRFGQRTANLLVKPTLYTEGRRYPLLIVLYYFQNRFITQAQIIPNFPIQAFAQAGFAVLLANHPAYDGGEPPSRSGKMATADGALASLEAAVATLVSQGIADPARVGIMGWSYGGFLTQLALTQSRTFAVGSAVDGGSWNPVSYWTNQGDTYRSGYDETFGGPPEGATLDAWKAFSPSFNTDKLVAPIMVETHTVVPTMHVQHLDFITHASCAGAPVEGVFYTNAPHVLTAPAQRMSSMERHLDWFRFWLLNEQDPTPAKHAQYDRWRRLQEVRRKRLDPNWQPTSWCRG